jgi:pimeloyl-ACP methyl ester carboxylesterase
LLSACAGPVRTTVRPWEPPAGRESLAEDLQHATPATVLNFARAAWGAATPGGPLSDSLESSINLATATIVRRLPEEAAAFEAAGLTLPPRLARGVAVEARSIGIVGISTRFERPGLGVPLSLETPAQARSNTAAKLPPEGQFVPATAVLTFDARACSVLSLVDPRKFEAVSVADDSIPLAADFTAPYARLLGETEIFLEGRLGILEAFAPERQGLFLLEPYDPDKIPLVMVHGLGGSPIGWRELTNRIFGTPDLRRRFQVWHYYYPTGTPYLWAGKEFREALDAALIELRIGTEDKSNDDVVLVGHSMGGMLVKTAVSNTGSLLWDLAFRVPPEQLDVREDDRETLRRVFVFERLPYVTRAVFVMSPHRGSEVAQSWFARFGTSLITLPPHFIGLFRRLAEADPEGVRPEFIELFRRGGPSSVEALRADHPLFPTLAEVPIDSAVQTHNIIGDVGDGTDGVVTKESAFLLGAASSAVLPVAHQNLEDPRVTESIVRILYQHAAVNKSESRERTFTPNPCPDR